MLGCFNPEFFWYVLYVYKQVLINDPNHTKFLLSSLLSKQGYWCPKSLIAAQGPLPDTRADFLRILYQQQTKTLVMLTDCKENETVQLP